MQAAFRTEGKMHVARGWQAVLRPRIWWVDFNMELFRHPESKIEEKILMAGTSDIYRDLLKNLSLSSFCPYSTAAMLLTWCEIYISYGEILFPIV